MLFAGPGEDGWPEAKEKALSCVMEAGEITLTDEAKGENWRGTYRQIQAPDHQGTLCMKLLSKTTERVCLPLASHDTRTGRKRRLFCWIPGTMCFVFLRPFQMRAHDAEGFPKKALDNFSNVVV